MKSIITKPRLIKKIPSAIKIGGLEYAVSLEHDPVATQDDRQKVWGESMAHEQRIRLDTSVGTDNKMAVILMHELSHALFYYFNLADIKREDEEKVCTTFGQGLFMLLKDNPKLRKYLNEVCEQ